MMHHSPAIRTIGMITWVITAVVSINVLTAQYGFDFIDSMMVRMPAMLLPVTWIIGISGIISLAMLANALFMYCPGCGACPCTCNKSSLDYK